MLQLNPPIPVVTPKGKALAYGWIDNGIEHDLQWICCQDSTGEWWTWRNQLVRAQINITLDRDYISPFYDPQDVAFDKASKPVSQQSSDEEKHSWVNRIKSDPMIPWNAWSDYLPDEGRFYFKTRRSEIIFLGILRTNHLNVMEIKLDARYRLGQHGMIEGWKPYD